MTEKSEILVDAFKRLKSFEGTKGAILVTETEKRARPFETGAMGKKSSVTLRVLTSLRNALLFISSANVPRLVIWLHSATLHVPFSMLDSQLRNLRTVG